MTDLLLRSRAAAEVEIIKTIESTLAKKTFRNTFYTREKFTSGFTRYTYFGLILKLKENCSSRQALTKLNGYYPEGFMTFG